MHFRHMFYNINPISSLLEFSLLNEKHCNFFRPYYLLTYFIHVCFLLLGFFIMSIKQVSLLTDHCYGLNHWTKQYTLQWKVTILLLVHMYYWFLMSLSL
jgi:hypothetical protein